MFEIISVVMLVLACLAMLAGPIIAIIFDS